MGEGLAEEIGLAEIPALQREMHHVAVHARRAPRHAGIDLPPDAELQDAERLHAGAERLAARVHAAAHAALDETRRDCREHAYHERPGALHAPAILHRLHG